ncbi:MAG: guanylate cyclase [Solirubrobacterales bacterium]|nr:guanylate cyclase [Solirubrobacterales bacterium]
MATAGPTSELSLKEAARRAGVSPATLQRWAKGGVIPHYDGTWTPIVATYARMVARLRSKGHALADIKLAGQSGQLAFGYIEDLFAVTREPLTLADGAKQTGLEPALIERMIQALGLGAAAQEALTQDDLDLLRYSAAVLDAGFPLVAFLQLVRVYSQALAQIADAEVRLFHLYVHEPLMRDGISGIEIAEQMEGLASELLPLAAPVMNELHRRHLRQFVEQDVIGHMEADLEQLPLELGSLRVAIAFVDLAGYTRLTDELGDEAAVDVVERFVSAVQVTLPEDARVIKTIGDGVMVVGSDCAALTDWAIGFQMLMPDRPQPRIGMHYGATLYRDGDYFGREVNLAARVATRAAGGEVLVTRTVVEAAGANLEFEMIGKVRLKGFKDSTELFLAHLAEEEAL